MKTNLSRLVERYMDNKNVYARNAVDDFNIRIKDNAYSLLGSHKNINNWETKQFKGLTTRFIDYCANQTNDAKKENIQAARKAFLMIKKNPKGWKELGHKILNANSYYLEDYNNCYDNYPHYRNKSEAEDDFDEYHEANRIIERDIFKDLYNSQVQEIKINPAPIWFQVFRSEVSKIAHNLSLLNPFNFLFKPNKKEPASSKPPQDHNLTIIGDQHSKVYYVNQLTGYIQSLVNNPEMDDKKIIIACEQYLLDNYCIKRRDGDCDFYDKIHQFNEDRKEKNQPLIELREIDNCGFGEANVRRKNAKQLLENENMSDDSDDFEEILSKNIDIGLTLLEKYKNHIQISEDTKEYLDDTEKNKKSFISLWAYDCHEYPDTIYKLLLSSWHKIESSDKKIIYEKIHPMISNDLRERPMLYYRIQLEKIKTALKNGDNHSASKQFYTLIDDPKIKDYLHFEYRLELKKIVLKLLDSGNNLEDKMDFLSILINRSMITAYIRSEGMLGEIREWRSDAEKAMEQHPLDSEDYKKAKEMSDAHIVLFTGISHAVDLKPLVDGAKILHDYNYTHDGKFAVQHEKGVNFV